jgi:putative transposase
MTPYDRTNYHRRSIRIKDYDYSQHGAYFLTICTYRRQCLLGDIVEDTMRLNPIGKVAADRWTAIPEHFPSCELDEYVLMPNHIHGILLIVDDARRDGEDEIKGAACCAPTAGAVERAVRPGSLAVVIRSFKAAATRSINTLEDWHGGPLWQRNYYEHVIRGDRELHEIRRYIAENSLKWALNRENPISTHL